MTRIRESDPLAEFEIEVLAGDDEKMLSAVLFQTVARGVRYADEGVLCATVGDNGSFASVVDSARQPAIA